MSDMNARFERDVDAIAGGQRPEDFESLPEEYRAMLEVGERVAMASYPARKAVPVIERTAPVRRNLLVPVGAALTLLVVGLAFSVGPALAEALVTVLTLGDRTTVNVVEGDFETMVDENGEVVIIEAQEHYIPADGEYDPQLDNAYEEEEYVPYEADFALRMPAYLPEGVVEGNHYAGERGAVIIDYSDGFGWMLSLTQGPNGSTVSMTADIPIEEVSVNGAPALWITAESGEGMLIWEADGMSFQLFSSVGDLGVVMQIAESIN